MATAWGLFVTTFGKSIIRPGEPYPPARHPSKYSLPWREGRRLEDHQVVLIEGGSGELDMEGLSVRIRPGDAMLLRSGVWHRYRPDPGTGWREHWIGFGGSYANHLMSTEPFASSPALYPGVNTQQLRRMFAKAEHQMAAPHGCLQQELSSQIFAMLVTLLKSRTRPRVARSRDTLARQTLPAFADLSAASLLTSELAAQLDLNYNSMRRAFREQTGMSPHRYRISVRLNAAKLLLVSTRKTVREIAADCGFSSEQYFCRLFKRHLSLTPGEYRRQNHSL